MALKNNYDTFKKDFTTQTGLTVAGNIERYLQYVTARCSDITMQNSIIMADRIEGIFTKLGAISIQMDASKNTMVGTVDLLKKEIIELRKKI